MTEDSLNNPSNAQIVDRAPTRKFSFLEAPRSIVEIDPKSFDEAAGITYSREPHWLLDFKALCATIQWEHPQSSPRGILTEIRNNAQVIRKWRRYAGFLQKLSAPRLGLETDVGRMSFEATREPDGVMSVSISLERVRHFAEDLVSWRDEKSRSQRVSDRCVRRRMELRSALSDADGRHRAAAQIRTA
jgi:hypothetical protein